MQLIYLLKTSFLVFLFVCSSVRAELSGEIVKKGKEATAFIESPGGSATAFCVLTNGIFVSNAHAVPGVNSDVTLVLRCGEADQKIVKATVIRRNEKLDLALLSTTEKLSCTCLELGDDDSLLETAQVIGFGYPFGNQLALKDQKYPNISVSMGRVSALRKANGKLEDVQLDATLNPGNSGGPVLDAQGKVIGVVAKGVLGANINFAIPVSKLKEFIEKPEIFFIPPHVKFAERYMPQEFKVKLIAVSKLQNPRIKLSLVTGRGDSRQYDGKAAGDDIYTINAPLLLKPKTLGQLSVAFQLTDGRVEGRIEDRELVINGKKIRLGECQKISRDSENKTILQNGTTIPNIPDMGLVEVELGGTSVMVDTYKASNLIIKPNIEINSATYTVSVLDGDRLLGQALGFVGTEDAPVVLSGGLIAHWKFDEGSGVTAQDSSDKKLNGSIQGASYVEGKLGKALKFTDRKTTMEVPGIKSLLGTGPVTVSVWVKADLWTTSWGGRRVFQCDHIALCAKDDGSVLNFSIGDETLSVPTPSINEWHHIAVTTTADGLQFFIDGKLAGEKKLKVNFQPCTQALFIGSKELLGHEGDHFHGLIDDVRIFGQALSAQDILELARP